MTSFLCSACGHVSPRWFGRCPECGGWSTAAAPTAAPTAGSLELAALDARLTAPRRFSTGIDEVDRVLGGGIVEGAAILLSGDPGTGKSTLVMQIIAGIARAGMSTILATGEESAAQVGLRARRVAPDAGELRVAASRSLPAIVATSSAERPVVLVVDSIQTLEDPRLEQAPGSVVQVRECASALVAHAKETGTAVVMVGHVTKDGSVAGPKTLEHVVDVVIALEGEGEGGMRLLRASKNRFGSCDEIGVFTMGRSGLEPVPDPSSVLLADRSPGATGSCVFAGLEGARPVLVEVQALVSATDYVPPRRVAIGVDQRRMSLLLAVMSSHLDLKLGDRDVFVSAAGGLAVREPAADLSICLALVSAKTGRALPARVVAMGEVGLGGEMRRVPRIDRRLAEAHRLGFDVALVPRGIESAPPGMTVHAIDHIARAFDALTDERVAV